MAEAKSPSGQSCANLAFSCVNPFASNLDLVIIPLESTILIFSILTPRFTQ